jgi:hypothetical protein
MATVGESVGAASPLNAALVAGVENVAQQQTVEFMEYSRQVLPLDGYIFWLKTGRAFAAQGSLHVAKTLEQREDETLGVSRVVFTAQQQIQDFDAVAPGTMYIGSFGEIRFAFSSQKNFYQQAGIYHYQGEAIYPAMATQIIDDPSTLDLTNVVVSNSLPIWLMLGSASVFGVTAPAFPIYPSFLVPQDVPPKYAVAHVGDNDTDALQSAPSFDYENSHFQLVRDRVRITLYGLRNNEALDFQDFVFQYSLNTDIMGFMSMPVIRDAKRTQREIGVISQKKDFSCEISYYQQRLETVTRQLIRTALVTYLRNPL